MKTLILLVLALFFVGCSTPSKIEAQIPGDGKATFSGPAADKYAQVIIQNTQTSQGRINETFGKVSDLAPWLFGFLIVGGVFAFFTKSKWAAMIPATAGLGLLLIFFLGATIGWIMPAVKYGFPIVVVGIIIWRAIVYQKERNNTSTALKVVSDNADRIISQATSETKKAMDALKNNLKSP
jgi:hypothetical protein